MLRQVVKKVIVSLQRRSARPGSARPRWGRLKVEALEARVLPSASLPLTGAALAPALVATAEHHSDNAGGEIGHVVAPDQPVYGYKHRPRFPHAQAGQSTVSINEPASVFLKSQDTAGHSPSETVLVERERISASEDVLNKGLVTVSTLMAGRMVQPEHAALRTNAISLIHD
jgi:hypothetical protein